MDLESRVSSVYIYTRTEWNVVTADIGHIRPLQLSSAGQWSAPLGEGGVAPLLLVRPTRTPDSISPRKD